jgi:hypothetical protein
MNRENRSNRASLPVIGGTILAIGIAVGVLLGNGPARTEGPVKATRAEIKATNLAFAVGMDAWSYHLTFEKPIDYLRPRPCEMVKRPDGSWERDYLPPAGGIGPGEAFREADLEFYITGEPGAKRAVLIFLGSRQRAKLFHDLDLNAMITSDGNAEIIDGCLILGFRVKPGADLSSKRDRVWMLGIELETVDPMKQAPLSQ